MLAVLIRSAYAPNLALVLPAQNAARAMSALNPVPALLNVHVANNVWPALAACSAPAPSPAHKDMSAVSAPVLLVARPTPIARTHNPALPANVLILATKLIARQLLNAVLVITTPYARALKDFKATQRLNVAELNVSAITTARQANNAAMDNASTHAPSPMPAALTRNVKQSTTQKNAPARPDISAIPTYNVPRTRISVCPARVARTRSVTTWSGPTSVNARLVAPEMLTAAVCAVARKQTLAASWIVV